MVEYKDFPEVIDRLVSEANFSLSYDVRTLLRESYKEEKNLKAKKALSWILENAFIAYKEKIPICQDTGLPIVLIEGSYCDIEFIKKLESCLEASYRKLFLRPSIIDPFRKTFPSYKGMIYHIDFKNYSRYIKITLMPKGFGSENKTLLKMFEPNIPFKDIEEFVIESVKKAGAEACPPFFIGVGIGGTSDLVLWQAKRALLDNLLIPNPDREIREYENILRYKINKLKIGPMGLGGKSTCLSLRIRTIPTHIAGLPVGVHISCHALRKATIKVKLCRE